MPLTTTQIKKLKALINEHTDAQTDKAFAGSLSSGEQADCRNHAKKVEEKLTNYIDGLVVVPRKKGYGK